MYVNNKQSIFSWLFALLLVMVIGLAGCTATEESVEPTVEPAVVADHDDRDDDHDDDHAHDHDDDHAHDDDDHAHDHDDDHAHDHDDDHAHDEEYELRLPHLSPIALADGQKLRVVATTSIIGDVVAQVSGDLIDLTVLMGPGVDPHGYEPSARELTMVADADVVFINGWDLEERLVHELEHIAAGRAVMVPVSAGVKPLVVGDHDHSHDHDHDHDHGPVDPHTWFDVANVMQWTENIVHVLSELDPANAAAYEANGAAYLVELEELDNYIREQVALLDHDRRKLVTNHDTMGYFARAYHFEVLGTLAPGLSTLAEPSARDLTALIEEMRHEGVCTIFVETIARDNLAQVLAGELPECAEVKVITLYSDALGEAGSGAESYIGLMRVNVDRIVEGLQ